MRSPSPGVPRLTSTGPDREGDEDAAVGEHPDEVVGAVGDEQR